MYYINQLHRVGISHYIMRKVHGQITLLLNYDFVLPELLGRTVQCRENSKDVTRNGGTVEGKWWMFTLCRTTPFSYVAVVFWEANWGGKPLTAHVARTEGRRKRKEALVRKTSGNYHKEYRGGHERRTLGYLESDSGWRPKLKLCVCYYIVCLQQHRIGITHTYIYMYIYKYIYISIYSAVKMLNIVL